MFETWCQYHIGILEYMDVEVETLTIHLILNIIVLVSNPKD